MENASRALIMAAGVLIGMAILSLAVYLIMSFGASTSETYQRVEEQRLMEFNAQFNVYEGETTVYDIVTVVNLAKENNLKEEKKITVRLDTNDITNMTQNELIDLIKVNNAVDDTEAEISKKFNCDISYENGRVNKVIFTTN